MNGLQIQMLAPASGPKPLPPSEEQAKVCGSEEKEIKDEGAVKMEVATDTFALPNTLPRKEGKDKVPVETCTEAILAGLKQREVEKAKGKSKAVAMSESKEKGETEPAPPKLPTVGKATGKSKAKGKSKASAAKVVPTIAKPKPGKPVSFGQCRIMHGTTKWRVTAAQNRRYDKAFSFKTPGAWDELVKYCVANK